MTIRLGQFLAVVSALGQLAAGLNLTFTGNCTDRDRHNLQVSFLDIANFNATGTTSFTARAVSGDDEPWYYYLTLHDGSQNDGPSSSINNWLGVPGSFLDSDRGNRTAFCMYTSGGHDKPLKNKQGNDTCDGVVSKKCIKGYKESGGVTLRGGCPSLDSDVKDECEIGFSTGPFSLSRAKSCFVSSLPGVDVPQGYGVVELPGFGYGEQGGRDTLEAYDKAVKRSIVTFFTFVENQVQDNHVVMSEVLASQPVCAIPNVVQGDSRPVDSAGEKRRQPPMVALAATVVTFILSAIVA